MRKFQVLLFVILAVLMFNGCNSVQTKKEIPSPNIHIARDVSYATFEDILEKSTDVVLAHCVGESQDGDYRKLTFEINDTLRGAAKGTITVIDVFAHVYVDDTDIEYETGDLLYEPGKNYMLVLEKKSMPFGAEDQYLILQNIFIPLDNLSESSVYGQPLSLHADTIIDDGFIDSVQTLIANFPSLLNDPEADLPYTASNDMEEMLSISSHVFQVQIMESVAVGSIADTETFRCDVVAVLKGNIDQESFDEGILITFPANLVQTGDECYVLANRSNDTSRIYRIVSENGVLELNQQNELQILLTE